MEIILVVGAGNCCCGDAEGEGAARCDQKARQAGVSWRVIMTSDGTAPSSRCRRLPACRLPSRSCYGARREGRRCHDWPTRRTPASACRRGGVRIVRDDDGARACTHAIGPRLLLVPSLRPVRRTSGAAEDRARSVRRHHRRSRDDERAPSSATAAPLFGLGHRRGDRAAAEHGVVRARCAPRSTSCRATSAADAERRRSCGVLLMRSATRWRALPRPQRRRHCRHGLEPGRCRRCASCASMKDAVIDVTLARISWAKIRGDPASSALFRRANRGRRRPGTLNEPSSSPAIGPR